MEKEFNSLADGKAYSDDKSAFFKKHGGDFRLYTSPMDQYSRYHKGYCFKDGAVWNEICGPETVTEEVTVKLTKVKVTVRMFVVEYFSSDCSRSRFYCEPYDVKEVLACG